MKAEREQKLTQEIQTHTHQRDFTAQRQTADIAFKCQSPLRVLYWGYNPSSLTQLIIKPDQSKSMYSKGLIQLLLIVVIHQMLADKHLNTVYLHLKNIRIALLDQKPILVQDKYLYLFLLMYSLNLILKSTDFRMTMDASVQDDCGCFCGT